MTEPTKSDNSGMLTGVANLASIFLGNSGSTSGTQTTGGGTTDNRTQSVTNSGGTTTNTTQAQVSAEAVQATINSILAGTSGLAAVASGQKGAGLYNSSTNMLLTNDLLTRASAEAARLSTATVQTSVAPTTNSTTALSGGTTNTQNQATTGTTVKNPAVSGGTVAGITAGLGAWGAVPKDIKDSILIGLGIKTATKTAGEAASKAGGSVTNTDLPDGTKISSVGSNSNSTGVAGIEGTGIQTFAGSNAPDSSFSQSMNASDTAEVSGGFAPDIDYSSGAASIDSADAGAEAGAGLLDGAGEAAGNIADGIGDFVKETVASAGESASSIFDNIGDWFAAADGGVVTSKHVADYKSSMASKTSSGSGSKHLADGGQTSDDERKEGEAQTNHGDYRPRNDSERATMYSLAGSMPGLLKALMGGGEVSSPKQSEPAGYANGGIVSAGGPQMLADGGPTLSNTVTDLKGVGYLANTGLRQTGGLQVAASSSESNLASVFSRLKESTEPVAGISLARPSGSTTRPVQTTGANSSAHTEVINQDGGGDSVAEGQGIGQPSGIANALGISSAASSTAMSAVMGLTGIVAPGLSGLANATNNASATSGFVSSIAGIVASMATANPAVGLAVAAAISAAMNSGKSTPAAPAAPASSDSSDSSDSSNDAPSVDGISVSDSITSPSVDAAASGLTVDADGSVTVSATADDGSTATGTANGVANASSSVSSVGDADGNGPASSSSNSSNDGASSSNDGASSSSDGSAASSSSSSDGDGGSGVGSAGDGGGTGFADGGGITVADSRADPSTTSDKIPAMLSEGEYVLSADVVAALGIPFLDSLQKDLHMPAHKQKQAHSKA